MYVTRKNETTAMITNTYMFKINPSVRINFKLARVLE